MNPVDRATDARVLAALDLTSLGEDDMPADIEKLCQKAASAETQPAAICVYPEHIVTVRRALDGSRAPRIAVATVVNFPDGANDPGRAHRETRRALAAGADEIDIVFSWRAYVGGDREIGPSILRQCKDICGPKLLKAIIETGELRDPLLIREVCESAIDAGTDFIKTSTGKSRIGATPEAAQVILECLRERGRGGFKASGGIRTVAQACDYLELAERICGAGWATSANFRIGSSSILDAICAASRARNSDQ